MDYVFISFAKIIMFTELSKWHKLAYIWLISYIQHKKMHSEMC